MRETRRSLKAVNGQLRDQIAVHNHVTRASLHAMLKQVTARNEDLVKTISAKDNEIASLRTRLAELDPNVALQAA